MPDVRRFDVIERVVRDIRRELDDRVSTILSRLSAHAHTDLELVPVFSGKCTTALTVNNLFTPITLNAEDFDSHNGHSTSSNTSRYTAQVAGYYSCHGVINKGLGANADGNWAACIFKNGTMVTGGANLIDGDAAWRWSSPTRLLALSVGDYVELQNYQDTRSNKTLDVVDGVSAIFDVHFIRPLSLGRSRDCATCFA